MQQEKTGFLLVDKPMDWTSHDVVGYLRGSLKTKRIGHAGTLDPFATGLLIVGVGRDATKRLDEFKGMEKEYIAEITLGATSDTQDRTGTIVNGNSDSIPTSEDISVVLSSFLGKQTQIPPMFSAKKVKGKKLYELARKGEEVERKPVDIDVSSLELISYDYPTLEVRFTVSTGTYIRTLAHDIGEKLGIGAYCHELRRTKIGEYLVENAKDPKIIDETDIFAL